MIVAPGAAFEWFINGFASGIGSDGTADLGVRIRDGAGGDFAARTTLGITEDVTVGASAIYRVTLTAPAAAGQFWLVADDGTITATEELVVTRAAPAATTPTGHDLCTLEDVLSYVPGYVSDEATDAKLQQLITAESELFQTEVDVEIVATEAEQPAARAFQLCGWHNLIEIGELASVDDLAVAILDRAGAEIATVDPADLTVLYDGARFAAAAWSPITTLLLHTGRVFSRGQAVRVTATWGFPSIPAFVREAVASTVVLRYASDVANQGTALADAINDDLVNIRGLVIRRRDAVDALMGGKVMIS